MGKYESDSLGNRMKEYEAVTTGLKLVPKEPIIIRLDGIAFHTFTKGMKKPFDSVLSYAMAEATLQLCKSIPTCVFGYTQSDEITLVLKLPDRIKSQSYYNNKMHKQISASASKAANKFMEAFIKDVESRIEHGIITDEEAKKYRRKYFKADFDSRVFNMPEWDIINNIIWRQQDCIRNSIEALGQSKFSSKQLHKKSCNDIKEMLLKTYDIDWNNALIRYKHGIAVYKVESDKKADRKDWVTDFNMPIITEDRQWFADMTGLSEE